MQNLEIKRTICNTTHNITLTDEELELAYRIMERRYLEEDFANAIAEAAQDPSRRFQTGHLEEFPELLPWLCEHYDKFFDANMSHNDQIELTINHLKNASLTPDFFFELANYSMAICNDVCSNITMENDRSKQLALSYPYIRKELVSAVKSKNVKRSAPVQITLEENGI